MAEPITASGIVVASVRLTTNIAGDSLGDRAFHVRYVSREVRDFPPAPPSGIVGWRVQLADGILRDAAGQLVNPTVPALALTYGLTYDAEPPVTVDLVPVCIADPAQPTPGGIGPVFWFGIYDVIGATYVAPAVAIALTGAVNFAIDCVWTQTGGAVPPFDPAFPP